MGLELFRRLQFVFYAKVIALSIENLNIFYKNSKTNFLYKYLILICAICTIDRSCFQLYLLK